MDILLVKDGTVPLAVARLVAIDGDRAEFDKHLETFEDIELQRFEVDDSSKYLIVTWFDGDGFSVFGYPLLAPALESLQEPSDYFPPSKVESDDGKHFIVTYGDPDGDCGYGHVFTL